MFLKCYPHSHLMHLDDEEVQRSMSKMPAQPPSVLCLTLIHFDFFLSCLFLTLNLFHLQLVHIMTLGTGHHVGSELFSRKGLAADLALVYSLACAVVTVGPFLTSMTFPHVATQFCFQTSHTCTREYKFANTALA